MVRKYSIQVPEAPAAQCCFDVARQMNSCDTCESQRGLLRDLGGVQVAVLSQGKYSAGSTQSGLIEAAERRGWQ